ncbi:MAG: hypothetical protein R3F20_02750 [Planctomycetota bacterium]
MGFLAFGRGVERFVPPGKGLGHVLASSATASRCPRRKGRGTLRLRSSSRARDLASRRRLRVSDFLSGELGRRALRCSLRHDLVAVRLAPPELELPRGGLVRLRCAETSRAATVDLDDESLRRDYAERVAAWRESTEASLRRARVDLMDVPVPRVQTKEAIAGPILRFFRMRELRGAKR